MAPELDKQLCSEFPLLFRDRFTAGPHESLMCFGFECNDGWFKLIYDLSYELERIIERMQVEGYQYADLPCASQVKEKFGSLRFYMDGELTEEMEKLVRDAERRSATICDVCGKGGQLHDVNKSDSVKRPAWWAARCTEHIDGID